MSSSNASNGRSLRSSRRKRGRDIYSIGDIVEIATEDGLVSTGKLLYKITRGSSPNPRWHVSCADNEDGDGDKVGRDIFEDSFHRLVSKASPSPQSSPPHGNENDDGNNDTTTHGTNNNIRRQQRKVKKQEQKQQYSKSRRVSNKISTAAVEQVKNKNKSSALMSQAGRIKPTSASVVSNGSDTDSGTGPGDNSVSDSIQTGQIKDGNDEPRLSARESRMLARAAKTTEDHEGGCGSDSSNKRKMQHNSNNNKYSLKKYRSQNRHGYASGHGHSKRVHVDEEVETVKMNTGTLYIYRGSHPRVEFIRRF